MEYIEENPVWYSDEISRGKIAKDIVEGQRDYERNFRQVTPVLNYEIAISKCFENLIKNYKTVLIPPKRNLNYIEDINSNHLPEANGPYVANKLFSLKNQLPSHKGSKSYDRIYRSFKEITGYHFDITVQPNNQIKISFRRDDEEWLDGTSCGLGLTDVLIMVFYAINSDAVILFIEEPENHLHPEIQRKFLHFLKGIVGKQFILSTHSNVLLDPYIADKIFYVYYDGSIKISDETSKSEILHNLGYSVADNLIADLTILTEGPSDVPVLRTIFEWIGIDSKYNIKYLPLCGDVMNQIDLSAIAESRKTHALIDSDPGSRKARKRFKEKCEENGIVCTKLERYSIENYFTLEGIKKIVGNIPSDLTEIKPNKKIDEQIGYPKGKTIKSKNQRIIQQMSVTDIESTDLYKFCQLIKEQLESQSITLKS